VSSHGDHRIAMTSAIAGLVSTRETVINGAEAASVSYPTFWDSINSMQD
ncbi:MAG: 3-phosphoshikimate 1-carboxyvinyltransferase, partial [Dehalococcoidia bacterium]